MSASIIFDRACREAVKVPPLDTYDVVISVSIARTWQHHDALWAIEGR
jgi:hypothetical protein